MLEIGGRVRKPIRTHVRMVRMFGSEPPNKGEKYEVAQIRLYSRVQNLRRSCRAKLMSLWENRTLSLFLVEVQ